MSVIHLSIRSFLKPRNVRRLSKMALIDLGDMRKPYKGASEAFDIEALVSKDPMKQFTSWFEQARQCQGIIEPNAMALATASKEGVPSVRMVLLKGYSDEGFRFFTNYHSRKGQDLKENPRASIAFFWEPLAMSVRIEGMVEHISEEESVAYFERRPKDSQIGASLATQSTVIEGRHILVDRCKELEVEYKDSEVLPKPQNWGGYLVKPHSIEFWQGQTTRVHDRIRFRRPENGEVVDPKHTHEGENGWVFERLAP